MASQQHFITDCPDRAKPKEGYICKICNEVSAIISNTQLTISSLTATLYSLAISFETVLQSIKSGILAGRSLARVMFAAHVAVNCISFKIVLQLPLSLTDQEAENRQEKLLVSFNIY